MNTLPAAKTEPAGLFTPAQIDLIKRDICKGASDDELKKFLWECERTRLDPFTRQIYSIQRREKYLDGQQWKWRSTRSTQVSIDGFRLLAQRSGEYAGQLGPEWCGSDGIWHDVWLADVTAPSAARVAAMRKDFEKPLWAVALLNDYAARNDKGELVAMWRKMPALMLAKCAEALALRRAFPHELSGLYTSDEMMQAGDPVSPGLSLAEEMADEIDDVKWRDKSEVVAASPWPANPDAAPPSSSGAAEAAAAPLTQSSGAAASPSLKERAIEAAKSGGAKGVQYLFSKCSSKEKAELRKEFGEHGEKLVPFYPTQGG